LENLSQGFAAGQLLEIVKGTKSMPRSR